MKNTIGILIITLILTFSCSAQNDWKLIEKTISELKSESPNHEGAILNSYSIKDLDKDGIYEIIESNNRIESTAIGFLNIELSAAFDFDKIYVLNDKQYVESKSDIGFFLQNKISQYELWKRLILNPENLNSDSKILVNENRESFLKEINWILKNINEKSRK
ncbi:hypothetical protein C7447_103422 [Tenacibaculum adriaticum]|uniref:Uncharacterized protein n=1 Tax=Tenacibaculum adriaticum TaxID=413713 RepID=A0A5S5DQT3_9FLAO|nr:hypothetical protein [Tenacibaculum adriaticum]TYP98251.1 hypothetical protein C7447_103422 [Tenacibaculum adriaticum]